MFQPIVSLREEEGGGSKTGRQEDRMTGSHEEGNTWATQVPEKVFVSQMSACRGKEYRGKRRKGINGGKGRNRRKRRKGSNGRKKEGEEREEQDEREGR